MSHSRAKLPSLSAALAGIPAGLARLGPWMGRRQLFVQFADVAETATIYTADALAGELERLASRSAFHSIAIAGRDPLAEEDFLAAAFPKRPALPLMLDHDGQRPGALVALLGVLSLVQVTVDGTEGDAAMERVVDSLARAAGAGVEHAVAIVPAESASDAQLLRVVERAHAGSSLTAIVLQPTVASAAAPDRRWMAWMERAAGVHADVRVIARG